VHNNRHVHRNFESQLLCPGKKGQHVHFCHHRHHAPVHSTHILPISFETLNTRRRRGPSPGRIFCLYHLKLSLTARRHATVPWTLIPRLFYLGLYSSAAVILFNKK